MANQVNKKLKVVVEVDGQKKLVELQTAIKLTEAELLRQSAIAEKYTGIVKQNAEARAKIQKQYLADLKDQLKMQQDLDRFEAEAARKKKAREQAAELRAKRASISQQRSVQDFWMRPSIKKAWSQWVSPIAKLRGELARQRDIEDEMTTLSVKGETPELRADAAAKAAAAAKAGKAASGKLAAAGAVALVVQGMTKVAKVVGNTFEKVLGQTISIRGNFREITDNVSKMTDLYKGMATYSTNSLIVSSVARQTQLTYGMSGGQAWAFNQARSALGVSSDEDLLYMTATQRAVFAQYMQKQEEWYRKLDESGALQNIQSMQLDLKLFKQEMSADFLQWIAENKDTIMSVAHFTLDVLKGLLQVMGKIFTLFGVDYSSNTYGFTSTAMSDAQAAGTVNNTSRSVNIKMNNNVNGMFNQTEMEQFLNERLETAVRSAATAMS